VVIVTLHCFIRIVSVVAPRLLGQQDLCKAQGRKMELVNQIAYTEEYSFELWDKFAFLTPLRLPNKLSKWAHFKTMWCSHNTRLSKLHHSLQHSPQSTSGPAWPVRQVQFWPYHFLALRLVGVGHRVGGEWHPRGGAQLM